VSRPPLDAEFFSVALRLDSGDPNLTKVRNYYKTTYETDICSQPNDSMERVMAGLYPDLFNTALESKALPAFRALLRLFTDRLASTTNDLDATQKRFLYRIINNFLWQKVEPQDITVITFNQDLQVEKMLEKLSAAKHHAKCSERIFAFPSMYAVPKATWKEITGPDTKDPDVFPVTDDQECLQVLKLHGSLNWYSTHNSRDPTRKAMLNQDRRLSVTQRRLIEIDMKLKRKNRTVYTVPVMVPPVTHKSSVVPTLLGPVWELAEARLIEADKVIVFGYSCPVLDFESANLLRRARGKQSEASWTVIDPQGAVATRYIDLLGLPQLDYYRQQLPRGHRAELTSALVAPLPGAVRIELTSSQRRHKTPANRHL
jgi:hypothetical protein